VQDARVRDDLAQDVYRPGQLPVAVDADGISAVALELGSDLGAARPALVVRGRDAHELVAGDDREVLVRGDARSARVEELGQEHRARARMADDEVHAGQAPGNPATDR
jgi:hypothetical protein